jgi:hypothetical protein
VDLFDGMSLLGKLAPRAAPLVLVVAIEFFPGTFERVFMQAVTTRAAAYTVTVERALLPAVREQLGVHRGHPDHGRRPT